MVTLFKMLTLLAWISVIGCPLIIVLKFWLQMRYEGSFEKTIDRLKGVEADYTGGVLKLAAVFLISLVFLIVK